MNIGDFCFELTSRSVEADDEVLSLELRDIIGSLEGTPVSRNSCPVFTSFSKLMFDRDTKNPIIFDEKFIYLNNSLSTNEEDESFECKVQKNQKSW